MTYQPHQSEDATLKTAPTAEQLLDGSQFVQHRGGGQFRTCAEWDASGVFIPLSKWLALQHHLTSGVAVPAGARLADAARRVLAASEKATAGCAVSRWAGQENGHGEEFGTELDAALCALRESLGELAPVQVPEFRDVCTDPDNCRRCGHATPTWDQVNHEHAGIPVGPQKQKPAAAGVAGKDGKSLSDQTLMVGGQAQQGPAEA